MVFIYKRVISGFSVDDFKMYCSQRKLYKAKIAYNYLRNNIHYNSLHRAVMCAIYIEATRPDIHYELIKWLASMIVIDETDSRYNGSRYILALIIRDTKDARLRKILMDIYPSNACPIKYAYKTMISISMIEDILNFG